MKCNSRLRRFRFLKEYFWYAPLFIFFITLKLALFSWAMVRSVGVGHQIQNLSENSQISPSATNRTHPESIWLVLNSVPGPGGQELGQLLGTLSKANGFSHHEHEYKTPWPRFLLESEQENLVTWFEYQHLPKSYNRHFLFINFTQYQKFTKEAPIYINMIQDPVEHIMSIFNARKAIPDDEVALRNAFSPGSGGDWLARDFNDCVMEEDPECAFPEGSEDFTLTVPFFCGQLDYCAKIGSKSALNRAKWVIEKYYSVVGVRDRFKESLLALEASVPRFFRNASTIYESNAEVQEPSSEVIREALRRRLPTEFDLYAFVNQRLSLQLKYL